MTREPRRLARSWPSDPLHALREEMEDLVSRVWGDGGEPAAMVCLSPRLDLSETADALEIRMDLPGVKPSDIDIQLNSNLLTVTGESKEEKDEKGRTYHRIERRKGTFSRSITLPCAVQENKIEAQDRDGILTITLPKAEEARTRRIPVKS